MVEKRRSPVSASPPDAPRRKKLNAPPDTRVHSTAVHPSSSPPLAATPTASVDLTPPEPPSSPALEFHDRFQLLARESEQQVTRTQVDAHGNQWRVHWHARSATAPAFVGVFVELVAHATPAACLAKVSIALLNQRDQPPIVKHTRVHAFAADNAVVGMHQFIARSVALDPTNAFVDAHGQVALNVRLDFVNDVATSEGNATAALQGDRRMVGLKNQGATCYLNSLLQTLFHLRAFRHVVYETPTAQEDTHDSVSLALQRVFYRLQRHEKAVSTKELTRAFGWSAMDAFMQHDVQELYRILCDRLEEKMKHTRVDAAIPRLFAGKVRSFVHCVDVEYESCRHECFYDLQLDVKGCHDLRQSFQKYVEVEMLQGENQYEADGFGKQDARKGMAFLALPPVLNIQLKRFEYDPLRDGMVKIHDRLAFPKTLALDEFMASDAAHDEASRHRYHLHSVLVHSGDVHGGHYYVFIRPGKHLATSTDWYKFDDDQITHVDEHVAIEGNFGSGGTANASPLETTSLFASPEPTTGTTGTLTSMDGLEFRSIDTAPVAGTESLDDEATRRQESEPFPPPSSARSLDVPLGRSFASAYMLVYVRDGVNDISAIQDDEPAPSGASHVVDESESTRVSSDGGSSPTDSVPIPPVLVTRFREEEKAAARRKKAQQTEHLYMTLRIASDVSVAKLKRITKTMDFAGFNNSSTLRLRIKRTALIRRLYNQVADATGFSRARLRLWKVITRENRTTRPDQALGPDVWSCSVESLIEEDASSKAPVKLFLQILQPVSDELAQALRSPCTSPSSPSIPVHSSHAKASDATIYRHFLEDVGVAVHDEGVDEDEALARYERPELQGPPPLDRHAILLFIKFYDVTKELGERLEYVGNVVVDSRMTGAGLARYLHDALGLSRTRDVVLYEEVQPMTVTRLHRMATLTGAEIQTGDIICFQYAEDVDERGDDVDVAYIGHDGEEVKTAVVATEVDAHARRRRRGRYPDVPSYFQYLLDRIDVVFYCYGHAEDKSFTLRLLLSHVYDDVIDAVAAHLGLEGPQRLFVRLYQHSPINNLPMKAPLRHARYAGDTRTTLEDFLTEYMDRTNVLYYEVLEHPITEIEAKKELLVLLSTYDACFATDEAASPSVVATPRHVQVLVAPTDTVGDVLQLLRDGFELPPETPLRACEVVHHGTMIHQVMPDDASLSRFWGRRPTAASEASELLVEQIPAYELVGQTTAVEWIYKGVVHFNYQPNSPTWIHPHGVPCLVRFHEGETVGDVKERIRQRMGIASSVFAQWPLALVKDLKATSLLSVYEEMDADAVNAFPMAHLTELCGADLESLGSLGLEHVEPTPSVRHHTTRRLETGIHIRQG